MYGLKYTVPFKTLSEVDCVVNIEVKDYSGAPFELIGGGTPFVINYGEGDFMIPIRPTGATLSVFGSDYLQDLYTSDPQGVRITLVRDGQIDWVGYMTPDTFSQDFSRPEFIYDIECVGAISTLKYKKFDSDKEFISFIEIIQDAVEKAGMYNDIYLTNAVTGKNGENIYSLASIATANFFDELGEAMTYYEVLEEIAKYLGCTFMPYRDELYLLDYFAIRKGFNGYEKYSGTSNTPATLSDFRMITKYKGTGTKLSRIAGKNKAVVNCSLYEIKDLLPTYDDEGTTFVRSWEPAGGVYRYYIHPKHFFYTYIGETVTETHNPVSSAHIGSSFVRSAMYDAANTPSRLSFSNELVVNMFTDPTLEESVRVLGDDDKILRMVSDRVVMTHPDVWLCIGFSLKRTLDLGVTNDKGLVYEADKVINHKAKLKIGSLYFNGSNWVNTESFFNLPMSVKKDSKILNVYNQIDNTNTFDKGLGDLSGYTFKAPDSVVFGIMEFTLYATSPSLYPQSTEGSKFHHYKDISIGYGVPDAQSVYGDWVDKNSKNDLIYENMIDGDYIEAADEIDLKICTNPDGKLALSSVISEGVFLEQIKSLPFDTTDRPEHILLSKVVSLFDNPRFAINPILNNNIKPYSMFQEQFLPDKHLIFAGGEEDVKMENIQADLIEL